MGQQHSHAAKAAQLSAISSKLSGATKESLDARGSGFCKTEHGNSLQPGANNSATDAHTILSGSSASSLYATDMHTKSVRAAIDSFIEKCVVGGGESQSSDLTHDKGVILPWKKSEVKTEKLNDLYEPSDSTNTRGTDDPSKRDGESAHMDNKHEAEMKQESPVAHDCFEIQNESKNGPPVASQQDAESAKLKLTKDAKMVDNVKEESSRQPSTTCDSPKQSETSADKLSATSFASPLKPEVCKGSNTPVSVNGVEESSSSKAEDTGDCLKDATINSDNGDGGRSIRLQTIIDRVLDTSLGTSSDLKSVPLEQQLLPKLAAEERAMEMAKNNATKLPDTGSKKTESSSGIGSRKEPMVCFMEHIQEAVERSFSSITEEEERKEKGKSIVRTGSVSKPSGRSSQSFKGTNENGSVSGSDSTISVQDIVDRVISQTEVISQMMTTSSASVSHTDTKPTATVSGTFYPSRIPVDTSSQRRGGYTKDESSREAPVPDRRRGRPRMQSPYLDSRDAAQQEYLQNSTSRAHSESQAARRGAPAEEHLHSIEATVSRIRPSPSSVHTFHPLMTLGPASSPAYIRGMTSQPGIMPLVPLASVGKMHHSAAGMHAAGGAMHGLQASHLQGGTQPPPLLMVGPVERIESQSSLQHQKYHTHPRSCPCTMCAMYSACESGGSKLPPPHTDMSQHSPHSPHHPYALKNPGASSQSPKYLQMVAGEVASDHKADGGSHSHSNAYGSSAPVYPPPQQPLRAPTKMHPTTYPPYGIQTGMPVPMPSFSESRQGVESRQHGDYHRHLDRTDFQKAAAGPPVTGQYEKAVNPPSDSSLVTSYPAPEARLPKQSLPDHHIQHHRNKLGHEEGPVLDLTVKRDMCCLDEEDKPLDLSKKTSVVSTLNSEKQDIGHMFPGNVRLHMDGVGDRMYVDPNVLPLASAGSAGDGRGMPVMERHVADMPDGKLMVGSQHLQNLETNMETYFQKRSQKTQQHAIQPSQHHGIVSVPPPNGSNPGVPHSGSCIPMPSHPHQSPLPAQQGIHSAKQISLTHHMPSHPNTPQGSQEPLLSPVGGRRPQLHPIPAPSLSTTLGPGGSSRRSSPYQSWAGSGQFSTPSAAASTHHGQQSPTAPPPPPPAAPQQLSGFLSVPGGQPTSPQPLRSESGGVIVIPESGHPAASRSASPPGSDHRGAWDERRRGSVSKHEPLQNILGNHNPADILYLICRQCRQTYGSPYGFRKHFRNMHGFEPKAEHTIVQTISATKNARQQAGMPQHFDGEVHGDDYPAFTQNVSLGDGANMGRYAASPQSDLGRLTRDSSPRSASSESPIDSMHRSPLEGGNIPSQVYHPRQRRSYSRNSSDTKAKSVPVSNALSLSSSSSSSSSSAGTPGVSVEEREDTKCLECSECKQTFQLNDFGSYKRHCRQHGQAKGAAGTGRGPGGYTCSDCQCSFSESHQLQDHLVRHEPNAAPIICHLCSLPFSTPYLLQEHMRAVHSQVTNSAFELSIPSSLSSSLSATYSSSTTKFVDSSARSSGDSGQQLSTSVASSPILSIKTSTVSSVVDSSGFNLLVTTPSNLEVRRLPADHIVTSASPDSSSDKKPPEIVPVSSSSQLKADGSKGNETLSDSPAKLASVENPQKVKTEKECNSTSKTVSNSEDDKDSGYSGERCPSNESRSISTESSLASPMETDESAELYLYKHKKFGAHRKRGGSNDLSELEIKQVRQDHSTSSLTTTNLSDSQDSNSRDCPTVTSATDSANTKSESGVDGTKSAGGAGGDKNTSQVAKSMAKTEARHQMPFVWDRVTRSQAGKHARSTDYT